MLFTIETNGKEAKEYHVGICGFRGCHPKSNIAKILDRIRTLHSGKAILGVQLFDAKRIATHMHILLSAIYALNAFRTSKNVSKSIETETMIYTSAQRQISDAINKVGLQPSSQNIALIAISLRRDTISELIRKVNNELGGEIDDEVLKIIGDEKAETIKKIFGISEVELDTARTGTSPEDIESAIAKRVLSRISIMAISK